MRSRTRSSPQHPPPPPRGQVDSFFRFFFYFSAVEYGDFHFWEHFFLLDFVISPTVADWTKVWRVVFFFLLSARLERHCFFPKNYLFAILVHKYRFFFLDDEGPLCGTDRWSFVGDRNSKEKGFFCFFFAF